MTSINVQGVQRTNELTNKRFFILFLLLFFSFQLSTTSDAADFTGALKQVTINNSGGSNSLPTAVINYTQNDDAVNFDATGSADLDGSIAEYRWDFGDGATGTGATISHNYSRVGIFSVTLTVVDNLAGVVIKQQKIDTSGGAVFYWSMDTLPATSMISDFGNVTITKYKDSAASVLGVKNNCMEQTGVRQNYMLPMNAVPSVKGRITFYAKHANLADSTYRYFFKTTTIGTANTIYAFTYKGSTFFYLYDSKGVSHRVYKTADSWAIGTWYKYEFIWDGTTGYLGIKRDGAILAEVNTGAPWPSPVWGGSQEFFIGDIYPIGSLDEFSIYNQ